MPNPEFVMELKCEYNSMEGFTTTEVIAGVHGPGTWEKSQQMTPELFHSTRHRATYRAVDEAHLACPPRAYKTLEMTSVSSILRPAKDFLVLRS